MTATGACAGAGVVGGCEGSAEDGGDAECGEGIAADEFGVDEVGVAVYVGGHLDVFEGEEVLKGIGFLA